MKVNRLMEDDVTVKLLLGETSYELTEADGDNSDGIIDFYCLPDKGRYKQQVTHNGRMFTAEFEFWPKIFDNGSTPSRGFLFFDEPRCYTLYGEEFELNDWNWISYLREELQPVGQFVSNLTGTTIIKDFDIEKLRKRL